MRTSRFRIRFAETKRIQSVDAAELEAMIRDGRIGVDDLVALGGQFTRYWEHPRFADLKPAAAPSSPPPARPSTGSAGGTSPARSDTSTPTPAAEMAATVRGAPLPPADEPPAAFGDAETSGVGPATGAQGAEGAESTGATIRADRARASVASGSRPRVQQLVEDRHASPPPVRPDRPRPEDLLNRVSSRPRQATVPAPTVGRARGVAAPQSDPAAPPTAPPTAPPAHNAPTTGDAQIPNARKPRPRQDTVPVGRPVAEESPKNAPFRVPGASADPSSAAFDEDVAAPDATTARADRRPHSGTDAPADAGTHADVDDAHEEAAVAHDAVDPEVEASAPVAVAVMPTAPRSPADVAGLDDPLDPRAVLVDGARPVVARPAPPPAAADDDDAPTLPSMRIVDDATSAGRPLTADELALGPIALRDQLLTAPVAHILGLDGPASRKTVNEAWKARQKQIESTWPRLTPDPNIRAGRADLLRLLNSTMRVLTVPRELRRWQARESELQRPAVYTDLFDFAATSATRRPTQAREANARLAELAREEKLAGARLPRRAKGSTEGLDPAVVAAGFTNEMLDAAGRKEPEVSIADVRRDAERRRMKVWGTLLAVAALLVFLSWTNACPQDLPS